MGQQFDVIVIGAGPAGEVAAGRLAQRGKAVALVERELVGGECSYWACMPSKALLRPGELLDEVARVPGAAEAAAGRGVDAAAALRRRDEVIHGLSDTGQLGWLDERGVTLLRGHARLAGERRVEVDGVVHEACEAVIVATGSDALVPPIPGLAEAEPWTNRAATTSGEVPGELLVLGGGVVGVELAQAWSTLGAQVTLIEAGERLIAREEPFASVQVAEGLQRRGVALRIGASATAVARAGDGRTTVTLEDGDELAGERLLVAIGRRPRTRDLGLETVGLEPGEPIEVDDALRVARRPWLYAIGDVNGRAQLTHMGKHQARVVTEVICGRDVRVGKLDGQLSPRAIFTDPGVAAVGHTLASAQEAGIAAHAVDRETSGTAGASFHGRNAPGTTRFVLDTQRELLVGATFVGPEVAELLHAATIAIAADVPLATLEYAVPAFPTRSELWLDLSAAG
ncbi:MAG TPA: NAD(P)/FAD-dependent oxidoreductase [Conexibacter sp.]|jgi:pyruvate/2-oxoglutarate dehydrogenase complex dihydrolipoamide dehydrogenase (E3) component|nr:NAD(P)/FAD-dependent oxidoreductase [Conexibacter sp.]